MHITTKLLSAAVAASCCFGLAWTGDCIAAGQPVKTLEYVQATGEQYVIVDYVPNGNTRIEADIAIDNMASDNGLFGSRCQGQGSTYYMLLYMASGGFRWDYGVGGNQGLQTLPDGNRHKIVCSGSEFIVDGTPSTAIVPTPTAIDGGGRVVLFACATYNTPMEQDDRMRTVPNEAKLRAKMKLYALKIYEGSDLKMDLLPMADDDGAAVLWDSVASKSYGSNSPTPLVAGPDRSGLSVVATPAVGTVVPSYGTHVVDSGTEVDCSAPLAYTNEAKTLRYVCNGYRLYNVNDLTTPWKSGKENAFSYVQPEDSVSLRLEWLWSPEELVADTRDWTFNSEAMTLSDASGWVLNVSLSGLELTVNSLKSVGTATKLDFSSVKGDYEIVKFADNDSHGIFEDQTGITEVVLPETLTYLGSRVFCNATNLEKVTPSFPEALHYIGHRAFVNCAKLSDPVTLGMTTDFVLHSTGYQFYGCTGIPRIDVGWRTTNTGLPVSFLTSPTAIGLGVGALISSLPAAYSNGDMAGYKERFYPLWNSRGGVNLFEVFNNSNSRIRLKPWRELSAEVQAKFIRREGEPMPWGIIDSIGLTPAMNVWIMEDEPVRKVKARLDYVDFTGSQGFCTGVIPTADLTVEMKIKPAADVTDTSGVIGTYFAVDGFCMDMNDNGNKFFFRSCGIYGGFSPAPDEDGAYTIGLAAGRYRTGTATEYTTLPNGTRVEADFKGMLEVGQIPVCGRSSTGRFRFYGMQMYEKGVLIRDFMPALDKQGTPCVFDKVEKKVYYSNGTQDFVPSETSHPYGQGIVIFFQ